MKVISYLRLTVAQAFYEWAMKEIDPLHPDVPKIMLRQRELADEAKEMWA